MVNLLPLLSLKVHSYPECIGEVSTRYKSMAAESRMRSCQWELHHCSIVYTVATARWTDRSWANQRLYLTWTLTLMMSGCRSCCFKRPNLNICPVDPLKQLTCCCCDVSASTTCTGNLFQLSTTRWLKKNFLMFRWLLSLYGLYLWPRRLWRPSLRVKKFPLSIDSVNILVLKNSTCHWSVI